MEEGKKFTKGDAIQRHGTQEKILDEYMCT